MNRNYGNFGKSVLLIYVIYYLFIYVIGIVVTIEAVLVVKL
jgi:hypothetical protein